MEKLILKIKKLIMSSKIKLYYFIEQIGLDPDDYSHLFDIKIYLNVSTEKVNSYAVYSPENNSIEINLINFINFDDEKLEKVFYQTFIHETLHANRGIYAHNVTNSIDCEHFCGYNFDLNIDLYKNRLYKLIEEGIYDNYDNIVPISIKKTINEKIGIYYNKRNKVFYKTKLNDEVNDLDDLYLYVDSNIIQESIGILYYPEDLSVNYLACHYDFKSNLDKINDFNKINEKINKQILLEECLIDGLSFIVCNIDKTGFDLENILNYALDSNDVTLDMAIGITILTKNGKDFLKWFINSCYEEEYTDRIYEIYAYHYDELLELCSDVYNYLAGYKKENKNQYNEYLVKTLKLLF